MVKEHIKKKFQDEKLPLVDEVYEFDKTYRECKQEGDTLRAKRNELSSQIGGLMREGKKDEAEKIKSASWKYQYKDFPNSKRKRQILKSK